MTRVGMEVFREEWRGKPNDHFLHEREDLELNAGDNHYNGKQPEEWMYIIFWDEFLPSFLRIVSGPLEHWRGAVDQGKKHE